jgi:hypothetical protein
VQGNGVRGLALGLFAKVSYSISGIQFVKDVSTRLQNIHIQVYDKNDQEGGTWAENRYPG